MTIAYNQTIRKVTAAFGSIFSNIMLMRYSSDLVEQSRMLVPIVYAAKEDYVMRLEGDPNLDKKVLITLPVMSYELKGVQYDAARKLNTNVQNFFQAPNGSLIRQYNPVPYNFDFELCIYVRNIEDGNQIVEHILPFFTPDYTISINMIPSMGDIRDVPITLNSTDYFVDYEGGRDSDPRKIIWTLNFTARGYIYPAVNDGVLGGRGYITHSITNIYNENISADLVTFNIDNTTGTGEYQDYETVYQGASEALSIASGIVQSSNSTTVSLSSIQGNFISNLPIVGVHSGASYKFTSYQTSPFQFARIDVVTNPLNATPNTNLGFVTTITEPTLPFIPAPSAIDPTTLTYADNYADNYAHE